MITEECVIFESFDENLVKKSKLPKFMQVRYKF